MTSNRLHSFCWICNKKCLQTIFATWYTLGMFTQYACTCTVILQVNVVSQLPVVSPSLFVSKLCIHSGECNWWKHRKFKATLIDKLILCPLNVRTLTLTGWCRWTTSDTTVTRPSRRSCHSINHSSHQWINETKSINKSITMSTYITPPQWVLAHNLLILVMIQKWN